MLEKIANLEITVIGNSGNYSTDLAKKKTFTLP